MSHSLHCIKQETGGIHEDNNEYKLDPYSLEFPRVVFSLPPIFFLLFFHSFIHSLSTQISQLDLLWGTANRHTSKLGNQDAAINNKQNNSKCNNTKLTIETEIGIGTSPNITNMSTTDRVSFNKADPIVSFAQMHFPASLASKHDILVDRS